MDTSPSPVEAAPDWESRTEPVHCPVCEYDLRGIREPRCPECGYTFAWAEILDPARRLHPYLFEHHPERRARSFRRTFLGELRPRRFWTTLHPAQPSHPRRLVLYWLLTSLMCYLVWAAPGAGRVAWQQKAAFNANAGPRAQYLAYLSGRRMSDQRSRLIVQHGSLQNAADARYPTRMNWPLFVQILRESHSRLTMPLLPVALPWLTFATLMIFQMSMRRARVRTAHVLRCAVYTGGTWFWVSLAAGASTLIVTLFAGLPLPLRYAVAREAMTTIGLMVFLAVTYQLAVAYRRYLRFPHPVATVLAAQFVAMLAVFTFLHVFGIMPF